MPRIIIQNTPIEFPSSGQSPNWSPAVITFAQAVETALQAAIGDFDVSPQVLVLSNNVNTNLDIPNLSFSNSEVRSASIDISVWRKTDSSKQFCKTKLNIFYDDVMNDWAVEREDDVGNTTTEITFDITPSGQVRVSTTSISGPNYSGTISYSAKALQKD